MIVSISNVVKIEIVKKKNGKQENNLVKLSFINFSFSSWSRDWRDGRDSRDSSDTLNFTTLGFVIFWTEKKE